MRNAFQKKCPDFEILFLMEQERTGIIELFNAGRTHAEITKSLRFPDRDESFAIVLLGGTRRSEELSTGQEVAVRVQ